MTQLLQDKDGVIFELWDSVWLHIQAAHPEITTISQLEVVLQSPDYKVKSNWSATSHLYYKQTGKYYAVVVVDISEKRIKTAYTTDKIKAGVVIWSKTI